MGIIIRTVARNIDEKSLTDDIQYLLHTWISIKRRYDLAKKPKLLYREADLVMRMVRDYFTDDVKRSSSMTKMPMTASGKSLQMSHRDNV